MPYRGLDVQIIGVTYQPGNLTTRIRLYNGGSVSMTITPDNLWLALGYAANPPGPRVPASSLTPFDLSPGQAADLTLTWPRQDEPYASFGVADYRFAFQVGN